MGGGKSSGGGSSEVRFAPYIEEKHNAFLTEVASKRASLISSSPFSSYTDLSIESAFFGTGYVLSSFPSLYDMYGKFMAGLDCEVLFNQIFADVTDGTVINNLVSAESTRLSDEIDTETNPRFMLGQRDINSVMSSTFVVGKGVIEAQRVKALTRFSTELRYRLIPVASERFRTHLQWNRDVVTTYANVLKLYIAARTDVDNHNLQIAAKNVLWPFTVLEYERLALGALTGATNTKTDVEGASDTQKAISGAMVGASAGYMVSGGNPAGAVIGGILGLAGGLL
jgi:hypothetical protein